VGGSWPGHPLQPRRSCVLVCSHVVAVAAPRWCKQTRTTGPGRAAFGLSPARARGEEERGSRLQTDWTRLEQAECLSREARGSTRNSRVARAPSQSLRTPATPPPPFPSPPPSTLEVPGRPVISPRTGLVRWLLYWWRNPLLGRERDGFSRAVLSTAAASNTPPATMHEKASHKRCGRHPTAKGDMSWELVSSFAQARSCSGVYGAQSAPRT
jgi:hypothetical protein